MRWLLLVLLLLVAPAARASDWRPIDTGTVAAMETVLAFDMMQTLDIQNHPEQHETNPILGPHPADQQVLAYFAAIGAGVAVGYYYTPKSFRMYWPIVIIGMELPVILKNKSLGLTIHF